MAVVDPRLASLEAENAKLREIIQRRASTAFGEWQDGLSFLVGAAEGGDATAVQVMSNAAALLERMSALRLHIQLPT